MKNGVLSNFTRSHISSDRVRSGYEIRLNSEWISISLFLAVRAVSRKSLSTFLNNIPAAIAWHMICSCRLSFTPISPAKKRYRFTPVTLCHAGFYLRHVTHCNVMGIASLGIVGLFPDPREILHECCFSINSYCHFDLKVYFANPKRNRECPRIPQVKYLWNCSRLYVQTLSPYSFYIFNRFCTISSYVCRSIQICGTRIF